MAPRAVIASTTLCLVVLSACSSDPSPQGDPDPGNRILDGLRPVLAAMPHDASVRYRHVNPPRWDSCDGQASTFGWDDVSVDAAFTTRAPAATVLDEFDTDLNRLGWHLVLDPAPLRFGDRTWTRRLPGGATARAVLNVPSDGGPYWELYAGAPPALHPVTGC